MNKGIINITYNRLNQPTEVDFGCFDKLSNQNNVYTYTKDKQGNTIILQEDYYYSFGMRMNGVHVSNLTSNISNLFLYNGKELQTQTGYYDYGFRQLDPQLGRWHVIDAMAESYMSTSPYAYTTNDPINHIDVMELYQKGRVRHHRWGRESLIYENSMQNSGWGGLFGLGSAHYNNYSARFKAYGGYVESSDEYKEEFSYSEYWNTLSSTGFIPAFVKIYIENGNGRWDGDKDKNGVNDLEQLKDEIAFAFKEAFHGLVKVVYGEDFYTDEDVDSDKNIIHINICSYYEYNGLYDKQMNQLLDGNKSAVGATRAGTPIFLNSGFNDKIHLIAFAAIHETGHQMTNFADYRRNMSVRFRKTFGTHDRFNQTHGLMLDGMHTVQRNAATIRDYPKWLFQMAPDRLQHIGKWFFN